MDVLTSESMNRRIYHRGAGIPAHRDLRNRYEDGRRYAEMYQRTVSRQQVPGYHLIRSILIDAIRSIFSKPARDEQEVHIILNQMIEDILGALAASDADLRGEPAG